MIMKEKTQMKQTASSGQHMQQGWSYMGHSSSEMLGQQKVFKKSKKAKSRGYRKKLNKKSSRSTQP